MSHPHDDPAGAVLARARALCEDMTFAEVRAWKGANPGRLVIGHMPIYSPRPLLEALGCLPIAIHGGGDQLEIIRGDSYFQSYICHIPRSTIELAVSGRLDAFDGMLFPSICDVIRNLGGMWQMLFPEKYSAYLDLPQNFDMAVGGRFYAQELRRIAGELTARGASALDQARLRDAIRDENARRAALRALDEVRVETPWLIRASEAYVAARAGGLMLAREHTALLQELVARVKERDAQPYDNVRVVVTGSFCEQPPLDLIVALEKAGCDIVDDDFMLGLRMIEGDIDEERPSGDLLDALAAAYLERGAATASRYIGAGENGAALLQKVKDCRADGVVFAAASFCDPALLDQPMLEAALGAAGVPFTSFKFAENTGQFQVIREQAGAFSDSVKLWGAA
ncbi:MAG: benzoyl-CoA reductase subunit C [Polyangiaceae bacterium]|nr:benzoyl-CoA reductase subunit C [Polyangiaceae bacterium]